ncbi:MAG: acyl-CoA dehydrogenase family protein [Sandaracinaceae bacterium]|nr:acyl-CoA dehydrogenase family protein [Sandaracinaceae bacterium]
MSGDARATWLATAQAHGQRLRERAAQHEAGEHVPLDVYRALATDGLMAVHVSPAMGGAGRSVTDYADAMMQVASGCASTAVTMAVTNMVGEVLAAFAQPSVSARYCPLLAAGGLGGFALSETQAGSDPAGMRTRATPLPDGGFRLDGDKQWISHGDKAKVLVVWARTERGISCFAVPGDAAGISVVRKEDKLGLRASATCALALEDVRVPSEALMGEDGRGFRVAMMALDGGRIGIASQAIGIGEGALHALRAHVAASRPGQLAEFALADCRTRLDAAKLLVHQAAALKQQGRPFTREASMAKLFATEASQWVCDTAADLVPAGHPERATVERCQRDVRVTRIYEGTSEIQRHVIAREVMLRA